MPRSPLQPLEYSLFGRGWLCGRGCMRTLTQCDAGIKHSFQHKCIFARSPRRTSITVPHPTDTQSSSLAPDRDRASSRPGTIDRNVSEIRCGAGSSSGSRCIHASCAALPAMIIADPCARRVCTTFCVALLRIIKERVPTGDSDKETTTGSGPWARISSRCHTICPSSCG